MSAILIELHRRQPLLAWAGWIALATLGLCLVAMALDGRTFNGLSVWTKPAKFAASFVPWFWTLAWAWGVLAPEARRGFAAGLVLWVTLAAALYEQGWITWRAAIGLPSHFAEDPLGVLMYQLMGLGAVLLVAMAVLLGVLVLLRGDRAQPRPWRLAVGVGLVLSGVLGGFTGIAISAQTTPLVGGGAGGLPPFYWSSTGGDLRVAHFLAVHAMQALPALALLGAGMRMVWAGAAGWAALGMAAYALALAGVPLSP
ncbi:hypothetical protein ACLF3G_16925 [Falsiroseomonas sp. HC035]|uniref:hypothetical protein n=1 Tax=Falsiroseomonas sp. HC035 TaxID=3390999 RepID=UPI003D322686